MSASLWSMWNSDGGWAWRPSAAEWTLLILLGASLLALRAFRESYLKVWVVGWTASLLTLGGTLPGREDPVAFDLVVQATFVLCRWAARRRGSGVRAVRDLILPLMVITPCWWDLPGPACCCGRIPCHCGWRWKSAIASCCSPRRLRCCEPAADDGNRRHGCWRWPCRCCILRGRPLPTGCPRLPYCD